jgi:hypothetical protein
MRNVFLEQTDWTQMPDSNCSNKQEWAEYRQKLRDITKTFPRPEDVIWPVKPQ